MSEQLDAIELGELGQKYIADLSLICDNKLGHHKWEFFQRSVCYANVCNALDNRSPQFEADYLKLQEQFDKGVNCIQQWVSDVLGVREQLEVLLAELEETEKRTRVLYEQKRKIVDEIKLLKAKLKE